jgi:hypothetical protein
MTNAEQPTRPQHPHDFPLGEWPAHHARFGSTELAFAVIVVRHMEADMIVLIGSCPAGDYKDTRDCFAEGAGYRWTFRGAVFDEQQQDEGRVRLRIRSEGDFTAERMHPD